jgi:TorA-specific chaperone
VSGAVTEARSSMYRLLASFFARELTQENIVGFQNGNGSHLLNALIEVETYAPFTTYLKTFFSQITDPQQAALDLAESYAWNFHGVGGPSAAPLYASVYLSESGATHQEVEGELSSIIRGQGLSSQNPDREAYDHLSVILEFIAWLDEKEESTQQRILTQKLRTEIIDKYLLTWLPAFVSQCTDADQPGFYSDLAVAALAFTQADFVSVNKQTCLKTGYMH